MDVRMSVCHVEVEGVARIGTWAGKYILGFYPALYTPCGFPGQLTKDH